MLELAEQGDHRNVDMLIRDIYGGDYSSQALPGDLIASSFGKAMGCNNSGKKTYKILNNKNIESAFKFLFYIEYIIEITIDSRDKELFRS